MNKIQTITDLLTFQTEQYIEKEEYWKDRQQYYNLYYSEMEKIPKITNPPISYSLRMYVLVL